MLRWSPLVFDSVEEVSLQYGLPPFGMIFGQPSNECISLSQIFLLSWLIMILLYINQFFPSRVTFVKRLRMGTVDEVVRLGCDEQARHCDDRYLFPQL